MIDIIIYALLVTIILVLFGILVMVLVRSRKLSSKTVQLLIDKSFLTEALARSIEENQSRSVEQTDGFLNFVSQSRDWAFKYIEDVQEALSEFDKKAGQELAWLEKYGATVETSKDTSINNIISAYKELQDILPKNN